VNEDALVWDRCHHIVLDEFINETAGTPLVDVRRRDPGRIPVLGNEFGFESFLVICRVVEYIRSSHGSSRSGRASSAPRPFAGANDDHGQSARPVVCALLFLGTYAEPVPLLLLMGWLSTVDGILRIPVDSKSR